MASVARNELFSWQEIEELGDLERLQTVIDGLPDEALMQRLETERGKGRDDYPVRAVWNSLLAGIVFEHRGIASLRRELLRNAQLRQVCGFDVYRGTAAVPPAYVYSRFLNRVFEHGRDVQAIFDELRLRCVTEFPGFGERLGGDGKGIASYARTKSERAGDRRGESEATWGVHEHGGRDGTAKVVKKWFGFTVHLIADTTYELPVAFTVTGGSTNEMPVMHKLLERVEAEVPQILERCAYFCADRGYDDGKLIKRLWEQYRIKPLIDIRNTWQDSDATKLVKGMENVTYDWQGTVRCVCPATGKEREMAYGGFEEERAALKYRCPARHYGIECKGQSRCPVGQAVRIRRKENPRIFTPLARSSYRWKRLYRARSAVERINSRLDGNYGFERHTIRGLQKMTTYVSLSFSIMLTVALARARQNRPELMRSLVCPAA